MTNRTGVFQLRISEEERAQWGADAGLFGDSVANWIRRCVRYARAELLPAVASGGGNAHGVSPGVQIGIRGAKTPKKSARKVKKNGQKKPAKTAKRN